MTQLTRRSRRGVPVALAGLLTLALAGCAEQETGARSASSTNGEDGITRAQAICEDLDPKVRAIFDRLEDRPDAAQVQEIADDLSVVLSEGAAEFAAVEVSGERAADYDAFVAATRESARVLEQAAEDEQLAAKLAEEGAPMDDMAAHARDLGLRACAGPDESAADEEGPADAQPVTVRGDEYAFHGIPAEVDAGTYAVTFENTGKQPHELSFVRLAPGVTAEQVIKAERAGEDTETMIVEMLGGTAQVAPGEAGSVQVTFEAGNTYGYACFLPAPDGKPHALHGMYGQVGAK